MICVFSDVGGLVTRLRVDGYMIERVDLRAGDVSIEVLSWQPPAAPKLLQLLEQAAVIAAREDSPAGKYIKQALEACKGIPPRLSMPLPTVDTDLLAPGLLVQPRDSTVAENPHLTDEQKARIEACDRAATQDKARDP